MSKDIKVIRKFEPFYLGQCACGCNQEIQIRNKKRLLSRFKHGHHSRISQKGNKHASKGDWFIDKKGYEHILNRDHPYADSLGYVSGHRLIYENYLLILHDEQIYIPKNLDIHHIKKVSEGGTNALINLELLTRQEHMRLHMIGNNRGKRKK